VGEPKIGLVVHGIKVKARWRRALENLSDSESSCNASGALVAAQQQLASRARWLTNFSKILALDEPTEGFHNIIDLIGETLLKIKQEGKISILWWSNT